MIKILRVCSLLKKYGSKVSKTSKVKNSRVIQRRFCGNSAVSGSQVVRPMKTPKPRLENKTCVITGAGSGLGKETTKLFIENGATVIGVDKNIKLLNELKDLYGINIDTYHGDVTDEESIKNYISNIIGNYSSIDVLVNAAGIVSNSGNILDCSTNEFDNIIKCNLYGTFWNFAGLISWPGIGSYVTAKHGVTGLSKSIASEYIDNNIRCNSVHPGFTKTPILNAWTNDELDIVANTLPTRKMAVPSQIVPMILFLASDESEWCNGQAFVVDKGHISRQTVV